MNLRIKYGKTGSLKYIGHLDIMRYFQKAIRRAKLDIAYSKGYSPHQIISFAAPMPLGMTSQGEYFDGEFNSVTTSADMVEKLNLVMADDVMIYDIVLLDDGAKNSMSVVSASDYIISISDDYKDQYSIDEYINQLQGFMAQNTIDILKKTKTSEKVVDIKPSIFSIEKRENSIYVLVSSGSVNNLKPNLVMEALCNYMGEEYNKYKFAYHRLETYLGPVDNLQPLISAGSKIV